MIECILSGSNTKGKSRPKPLVSGETATVNLNDLVKMPINDQKAEKSLTMRLLNSKGVEIAKSEIKMLTPYYVSEGEKIEIRGQKFDLTGDDTKKGLMNLKFRYVTQASGAKEEVKQEQPQKPIEQAQPKKEDIKEQAKPQEQPKKEEVKEQIKPKEPIKPKEEVKQEPAKPVSKPQEEPKKEPAKPAKQEEPPKQPPPQKQQTAVDFEDAEEIQFGNAMIPEDNDDGAIPEADDDFQ